MNDRDFVNLCDEIDGRLTRITIRWPETWWNVWKQQKHVRYALQYPERVNQAKVLKKTRDWLVLQTALHQGLDEHFIPIINNISAYLGDRAPL